MIRYDEQEHRYYYGDKQLISVTQLMQKHGLAPDYSEVSKLVLKAKAQRGTLIHQEIQDWIEEGTIGFTTELTNFIDYMNTHKEVKIVDDEFIVYNDIVAGRADLLLSEDNNLIIADIKTTAIVYKESVSWQLSIYAYLSEKEINKGRVFHFDRDGNLIVFDIPLKPKQEVERLFECERNNDLYICKELVTPPKVATLFNNQLTYLIEIEKVIKHYENMKKEAETQAQEMRVALLNEMEKNGVKTFENDNIKITYVAPSVRKNIDSSRLKKEEPIIYEKYLKDTNVKASLKITLKEE